MVTMQSLFSRKNLNLVVGLLTLLIVLWAIMYAVPNLFVNLFMTWIGLAILAGLVILAGMYNMNMGIGMAIVFIVLYRFSHMRMEPFIL